MSASDDSWKDALAGTLNDYGMGDAVDLYGNANVGPQRQAEPPILETDPNAKLREQMMEREVDRSALRPVDGDAESGLVRATFMLNAASKHSQGDAMKEWLKAIYRAATVNGVKPTPEVARVFDRMLATDAAIDSSKAGAAMSNEAGFFEAINGLGSKGSGEWSKKDRINYKAALNKEGDEYQRLQELYDLAEAEVSARMDKEALKERNQRWKTYYAEGKELAQDDVFYDVIAALTVKKDAPFSGISRDWLERMAVKAVNPDFNPSSRSAFLRDRGVVRLLNMFSSAVVLFAQRRAYNAQALKQA
jgi:hypothetical protein